MEIVLGLMIGLSHVAVMWKLYRPELYKTVGKCLLLFMWYSAEPKNQRN